MAVQTKQQLQKAIEDAFKNAPTPAGKSGASKPPEFIAKEISVAVDEYVAFQIKQALNKRLSKLQTGVQAPTPAGPAPLVFSDPTIFKGE